MNTSSLPTPSAPEPARLTPAKRHTFLPDGPTAVAFHEIKAAVEHLHAVVRRYSANPKTIDEPVRGALTDTQSLDDQLHAVWTHLDRVLRGVPPFGRRDPSRWQRPRYPLPDLTGDFGRLLARGEED